MLLDRHLDVVNDDCASGPARAASADLCDWSVILPFHDEASLVASAIASLARQSRRFVLVLVDNGSTDGGAEYAAAACRRSHSSCALREVRA